MTLAVLLVRKAARSSCGLIVKGKRKKERKKTGLEVDVGPSGERQLCRLTVEEEERGESARLKDSKFTVSHSLGPKVHPLLVFSSGHVIFYRIS